MPLNLYVDVFLGDPPLGVRAEKLAVSDDLVQTTVRGSQDGSKKSLDPSVVRAIKGIGLIFSVI